MSLLVDTCGWIEWVTDGPLAELFAPYLAEPTRLIVPTVVQYELYKWGCRERDQETALQLVGLTEQGSIVPLDTPLALLAAELSAQHSLAMADAIVYATARRSHSRLVTCDAHFAGLAEVEYLPKTA